MSCLPHAIRMPARALPRLLSGQVRMQVDSTRGVESAVQQQVTHLQQQLTEATKVIELTRAERTKLQVGRHAMGGQGPGARHLITAP